ncbi:MAG: deoxyribonuclease IV [Nitrososphaeria archaeon]|nr:deoxyribonuclease IV [Conexivisphaerales archaeon]
MEIIIGAHMPITGGLSKSAERARELKFEAFQIFTRNPRGWRYPELKEDDIKNFLNASKGFSSINTHMPYLPNLASSKEEIYKKSVESLIEELRRAKKLQIKYIVVHVGSHLGEGIEKGKERVIKTVKEALDSVPCDCHILLENMAGQKNSVGSRFEDLGEIISGINDKRVGICLDTCHAFAAGYDIATQAGLSKTLDELEKYIGLRKVMLIHLNDSKSGLGSGSDRHERIGKGFIGRKGFENFFKAKELIENKPMIFETPVNDYHEYLEDYKTVMSILKNME